MSEYRNDPEYGKDDDYPMTCDKCGAAESEKWHEFVTRDNSVERVLCTGCFKAGLAPQPPVPPANFNALLSDLSCQMSTVAGIAQLSIVSMHDEDSVDAVYTLLRDHEDVLQKLTDMAEKRLAKIRE